ncbi:MAG: hypothetical protein JGK04_28990 [Microcoleus sp. PH2017_39_LGB_O_B]|uniref:hypothetical protein n=1 Tax=unclassified Microcoleus TaxID=2642155 RepID=UPI001DD3CE30|nr:MULTISPECIES: hypothetical protein [unclassified Microcoleus]MCC3451442.1 hypothetical protein [Microcoleus sp. PH2017_09_SFU_O_A]MCC3632355.1 hypothetical protein [Microcoleus sp. PH2017_39_LGB_O_B]MCC3644599.1 hypothetical protein [Microcoleus sp. PH2017_33_LGB_O_A]
MRDSQIFLSAGKLMRAIDFSARITPAYAFDKPPPKPKCDTTSTTAEDFGSTRGNGNLRSDRDWRSFVFCDRSSDLLQFSRTRN